MAKKDIQVFGESGITFFDSPVKKSPSKKKKKGRNKKKK